jgi:hypothetical protein
MLSTRTPLIAPARVILTLLAASQAHAQVRVEILAQLELTCRGRLGKVRLERLEREGAHRWRSEIHVGRLVLAGLVPLAGRLAPGLDPAGEVRQGLAARFVEPWGVAEAGPAFQHRFPQHPDDGIPEACWLVADHGAHTVRCVYAEARVAILAGHPGRPGFNRFQRPLRVE